MTSKDLRDVFFENNTLNYNKRLQKLLLKNFKNKKRRKYSDETLHIVEYSTRYWCDIYFITINHVELYNIF